MSSSAPPRPSPAAAPPLRQTGTLRGNPNPFVVPPNVRLPIPPPPPPPSVPVPSSSVGPSAAPHLPVGLWRSPNAATPLSLRASGRGTHSTATLTKALAEGPSAADTEPSASRDAAAAPSGDGEANASTTRPSGLSGPPAGMTSAGPGTTTGRLAGNSGHPEDDEEHAKLVAKEQRLSWDDIEKMGQSAQRVRAEILSTEDSYLRSLTLLHKAYVVPLQETDPDELGIEDYHQRTLVSNLGQLMTVHTQFYDDLVRAGSDQVENTMINYSRYFKMYSVYLNDYLKCLTTLEALRRSKHFQAFVTKVNERLKEESSLGLMDYLIMPVQRLPRYVLLLRELRRNTLPSTAGYDLVNVALAKVRETATAVNEKAREAEKMQELAQIYHSLTGDVKDLILIEAHRRLIRKGDLMIEESRKGGIFGSNTVQKVSLRTVFLFNDIILWANKQMVFKSYMMISSLEVVPSIPKESVHKGSGFGCILTNSKGTITLHFANEDEFNSWIPDITSYCREQKMMRQQKRVIASQRVQSNTQGKTLSTHSLIVGGLNDLNRKTLQRGTLAAALEEGSYSGPGPSPTAASGGSLSGSGSGGVTPAAASGTARFGPGGTIRRTAPSSQAPAAPLPAGPVPATTPSAGAGPQGTLRTRGTLGGGGTTRPAVTSNLGEKLAALKLKQQQKNAQAAAEAEQQ